MTDQLRRRISHILGGPTGGMLACIVLAAFLGGVATANPGGEPNEHAAEAAQVAHENAGNPDPDDRGNGATPGEHTAADCDAAIEGVDLVAEDDATGIANATYSLLANCQKNLQAPGRLVALGRLADNFERHMAHEEAKAEGHGKSGSAPGHTGELPGQAGDHGAPAAPPGS